MPEFNVLTDMVASLSTRMLGRSLVPTQPGLVSVQDIISLANVPDVSDFLTQAEIEALIPDVSAFLTQTEIEALPGFGGGSALPVGIEMVFQCATIPSGWVLENGQAIDETTPLGVFLLAAGQVSNGDGTVNTFDRRGRAAVGASTAFLLGSQGGETGHTLTISEMPSHGGHATGFEYVAGGGYPTLYGYNTLGGNLPHNNLQPYFAANWIIFGG